MTKHEIAELLTQERQFRATMSESMAETAKIWHILKSDNAHLKYGYDAWKEFVYAETPYSISYVDFWCRIWETFGRQLETPSAVGVTFERLRTALSLCKTPEDAEHWFDAMQTLPETGWKDAIREAKGTLDCKHTYIWRVDMKHVCEKCGSYDGGASYQIDGDKFVNCLKCEEGKND